MAITSHCSCGQLHLAIMQPPERVSICHCYDCQRRSGSAFASQARFAREAVTAIGKAHCYQRNADSGAELRFYFCPDCGTTVYYQHEHLPDWTMVPTGGLTGVDTAPTVSVYEARQKPWLKVKGIDEHYD